MEEDIKNIKEDIKNIKESLNRIERSCNVMNNHVSFVETTYTSVKAPMDYVLGKVNSLMGSSEKYSLPTLQNNNYLIEKDNYKD